MESTVYNIRKHYEEMGKVEKRIADYMLEHMDEIVGISISELAEQCRAGEATVVRFARRLGFSGYQSLKIRIAQEFKSTSALSREITAKDSCFEIYRKRVNDLSVSLEMTETVLDPEMLEKAANLLMKAKRIVVIGLGNSAGIAADAAHKFARLGYAAESCSDNHMQAIIASHLGRDAVLIGISHSGASRDIVEALELSKIGGAKTIAITNVGKSPIVKAADITLFTKSEETKHSILALHSRIAQMLIFDAIYSYIITRKDKDSLNAIYNTEYALERKKY